MTRASTRRAAIVLACLTTACAGNARDPDTLVIASGADLESANPLVTVHPLSRQIQRHALLLTLRRYDDRMQPEAYLARSVEWSSDRRELTAHLASDARWHDGKPVTAHDAEFTFATARNPSTGYPRAAELAALDSVRAGNDSTLVIWFSSAQPVEPAFLAELPLLPVHLLGRTPPAAMRTAGYAINPVGSGPFRFVRRDAGQRWIFERVEDFPASLGGPARARRLVVAVVDEAATKFAGLVSGELDLAGISPSTAPLVARDPALRLLTYPVLFTTAAVFNSTVAPFDDTRVRLAASMSIDRTRIVRVALNGYGTPAAGGVSPGNPLAIAGEPERDTLRADSLLDAAGWRRGADGLRSRAGTPLRAELLTVGSADNAVEQLLQADLAARGFRVDVRQLELAAFLAAARAPVKRFGMLLTGIPGDLGLAYLSAMFDSREAGGALDYAGFRSSRLDSLFMRARTAADAQSRTAAWAAVQRALADEMPVAWLYHSRGVQGVSRRLGGVEIDLRGELATVSQWHRVPSAP